MSTGYLENRVPSSASYPLFSVSAAPYAISPNVGSVVRTTAADAQTLVGPIRDSQVERGKWQNIIDNYLIEWGKNPSLLEDEDIEPPSSEIISFACLIAQSFRDKGLTAPMRVAPNGAGGIVFERWSGQKFESIEIHSNQEIELCCFKDSKLIDRKTLQNHIFNPA